MEDDNQPSQSLSDEFEQIGKNLLGILRAVWDSPERKQLSNEIETGIQELSTNLKNEISEFETSPTGERIKSNIKDLKEQIQSGEAEEKIRNDIIDALRVVNSELQRASDHLKNRTNSTETTIEDEKK